jgi:hypothetical protein
MKLVRTGLIAAIAAACSAAVATPVYTSTFTSTYGLKPGTRLGSVPCSACHVGNAAPLNPYGKDILAAMKKAGSRKLTPAMLKSLDGLDSDKDGYKNVLEIKADHLPGDPKDTPKGHYPPPKSPPKGTKPAAKP